ncbi:MAG: phospho-N-acetylmuramoyl-pentapeptide-transferase [Waddliaceae bacterium]
MQIIFFLESNFGIKFPVAFHYTSTRMLLASLTALLITIFLGPAFIRKLKRLKIGQNIRKEECPKLGQLHEKKESTPTMGGVLVLFSMSISMLLWMNLSHGFTFLLFVTTVVLGSLGGVDDYMKIKYQSSKGISGKTKIYVQLALSLFIAGFLYFPSCGSFCQLPVIKESLQEVPLSEFMQRLYLPFVKNSFQLSGGFIIGTIFIALVITGASNAVNLTDGLDGLAIGCLVMVASAFALIAFLSNHFEMANYLNIAYIEGSSEIAVYLLAFVGAGLGFLWYNGFPAEVIMGDTGSLALGGIIGVSAVLLKREVLLALIGGVFVAEAISVIVQVLSYKFRNKKRVFLCAPLHHHFEFKGWPESKVVIRFWIIGLLLAIVGIASLKLQ